MELLLEEVVVVVLCVAVVLWLPGLLL